MKKFYMILSLIVLLSMVCASCSIVDNSDVSTEAYTSSSSTTDVNETNIKETDHSNNRISIFEKELQSYSKNGLKSLSIKIDGEDWRIEGKKYKSISTLMELNNRFASWKIDLSEFSPIAKCKDIVLYSPNENCLNSVLVAVYGNNLCFLVCDNILSPEMYSVDDFTFEVYNDNKDPDLSIDSITKLWEQHLAAEHDLSEVLLDEKPHCIRLRLKSNPELIYTFSYIYYVTYYCTPLPYVVNS